MLKNGSPSFGPMSLGKFTQHPVSLPALECVALGAKPTLKAWGVLSINGTTCFWYVLGCVSEIQYPYCWVAS